MASHHLAGKPAPESLLANVLRLIIAYYTLHPGIVDRNQRIIFGTSGHRGSSFKRSSNEDHILAVLKSDQRKEGK